MAILGTLLVGIVMARARFTRQSADTLRTERAVRATDELIAQWWAGDDGVPIGQSGEMSAGDGQASFEWQTREVPNTEIEKLGARVVRVEVRPQEIQQEDLEEQPLVSVDLVLPLPEPAGFREDAGSGGVR